MELRFFTGPAFLIVGALMLTIALRLWLVHPINRVFRIGPFVTERGMKAILRMRMVFASFGALTFESGVYRCSYWFFSQNVHASVVVFLGSLESGLAGWAAIIAIIAAVRVWRVKP